MGTGVGAGVTGSGVEGAGAVVPGTVGPGVDGPGLDVPGVVVPGFEGPGLDVPGVVVPGAVGPGTVVPGVGFVPGVGIRCRSRRCHRANCLSLPDICLSTPVCRTTVLRSKVFSCFEYGTQDARGRHRQVPATFRYKYRFLQDP